MNFYSVTFLYMLCFLLNAEWIIFHTKYTYFFKSYLNSLFHQTSHHTDSHGHKPYAEEHMHHFDI